MSTNLMFKSTSNALDVDLNIKFVRIAMVKLYKTIYDSVDANL